MINNIGDLVWNFTAPPSEKQTIANLATKSLDEKLSNQHQALVKNNRLGVMKIKPVISQSTVKLLTKDDDNALFVFSREEIKVVRDVFHTAGWKVSTISSTDWIDDTYHFSYEGNKATLSVTAVSTGLQIADNGKIKIPVASFGTIDVVPVATLFVENADWYFVPSNTLEGLALLPIVKKLTEALY